MAQPLAKHLSLSTAFSSLLYKTSIFSLLDYSEETFEQFILDLRKVRAARKEKQTPQSANIP